MISKEQIESGCEIWIVLDRGVFFSTYNNRRKQAINEIGKSPMYHTSKYEAEMYVLGILLNDN